MIEDRILEAAKGGAFLGLATTISFCVVGRIVGMSGTVSSLITFNFNQEYKYKLALLGGMLFAGGFCYNYLGMKHNFESNFEDSPSLYLISGFLVGLGTRLGSGCTSGHGLCGLPRLSLRSITATFVFLATGILTASSHLKSSISNISFLEGASSAPLDSQFTATVGMVVGAVLFGISLIPSESSSSLISVVNMIVGMLFSYGLLLSGMTKREKVNGFLDITLGSNWDPSLFAVLMTGVGINFISFNFFLRAKSEPRCILGDRLPNPQGLVDWKLVTGALIFGLGWGLGSMCPGPVLVLLTVFQVKVQGMWLLGCAAGMYLAETVHKVSDKLKIA